MVVADPLSLVSKGVTTKGLMMTIDLDVDIGADAVDYNAIANQESLSGLETEMRKLESVAKEVVEEMEYLKRREMKMRDTNGEFAMYFDGLQIRLSHLHSPDLAESTNARVELTAWLTVIALISLGVWQVTHLRGFFQKRYLIDS